MKKRWIALGLAMVIALALAGDAEVRTRERMYLGKELYKIRKDDALERIKSWNAVLVIRDDTSFCYLISRDYRHVCKAVRFDNQGEIIATAGIDVLKITADQVKEPDSIPEMLELYGQPHFDNGYGFYLPGYILADASILIFSTAESEVTGYWIYRVEEFL